jgi:hypothetical protein
MIVVLLMASVSLFVGCSTCGEDIERIDKAWYDHFNSCRRPTAAEVTEYAALDEAGKASWKKAGKPVLEAIDASLVDVADEHHAANQEYAAAAMGEAKKEGE